MFIHSRVSYLSRGMETFQQVLKFYCTFILFTTARFQQNITHYLLLWWLPVVFFFFEYFSVRYMDCGDPIAFGSPQTKQVTLFVVCMYSVHTLVCVYTIIGYNIGPLILFKGAVCNITSPSYLVALQCDTATNWLLHSLQCREH